MELLNAYKSLYPCIVLIPAIPLCFYPVLNHVKSRWSVLVLKITISLALFITFFALVLYFFDFINIDVIVVCSFFYFFYFYSREVLLPFTKKMFVFLTVCLLGSFSLLLATIVDFTLHPDSNYLNFSLDALYAQLLFLLLENLIFYFPFSRYFAWILDNFHVEQVWNHICFLPVLFIPVIYTMIPHEYSLMTFGRVKSAYPTVIGCILILVLLVYWLFYTIAYTYVQKQKSDYNNQLLSIQELQYQQLLKTVQESSQMRHDFRHQLIVISELLKQKEYTRLSEYVHAYVADTATEFKLYSYSAIINALLSYYESLCRDKNIRTDFSLHLPTKLSVTDQHFCVILGNLLENAIYGCQGTEDPYIHLKIRQTSTNILAIKIANPYQGTLKKVNEQYLSSRHKGVGQGLVSVSAIAEHYQGMMDIQTEHQIFTVKVLLQVSADS